MSTLKTRPALSVFFHALNVLIRSKPVHGTSTSGVAFRWVSAVVSKRRHWLYANRDAPACRASSSFCSTVGSRQNWNVVCRDITDELCIAHRQTSAARCEVPDQVISVDSRVTRNHP
jgi:hypothetical protein